MKFEAKVSKMNRENAKYLLWAFFQEFNPENSILIKGNEARVEVFFEEPPMKIIEAITFCEGMEFKYGKAFEECNENEIERPKQEMVEEETREQPKQEMVEEETPEQPKQKMVDEEILSKPNLTDKVKNENSELTEIAKRSNSYEEFVNAVAMWLNLNKRQDLFVNVIKAAMQIKEITWLSIEKILKSNKCFITPSDRVYISNKISTKFTSVGKDITMMKLIKLIVEYQGFKFNETTVKNERAETETIEEEQVTAVEKTTSTEIEENILINRVKMECMPEIPDFEKILGSVDKTQPIESRVKYVLTAMGWNEKNTENGNEIFEIANQAVRLKKMDFNTIGSKAKISKNGLMEIWMIFSTFINKYVKKYDSSKKVKSLDFLIDLQKIIMKENEIVNN